MEKALPQETSSSSPGSDTEIVSLKTNYGDAEVQFGMGLKFATDTGAAQDYGQAAEWYHKAAAQNHSLAQFNLGVMYAQGQGVTRDSSLSAAWFGKAAKLGDAGAQFHLGESCQRASFGQKPAEASESRIEAYKWYRLAATQGYKDSEKAWITLSLNMTREDVTTGNQRVAAFEIGKSNLPRG
jgi:TPR repeat protein